MENKKLALYVCPFCKSPQYFNTDNDFELHLYKNHLRESLHMLCVQCIKKVSKTAMKWHVK